MECWISCLINDSPAEFKPKIVGMESVYMWVYASIDASHLLGVWTNNLFR